MIEFQMRRLGRAVLLVCAALQVSAAPIGAETGDQIRIVGSSTIFPFAIAVAERFAEEQGTSVPVVEATGTGGGFKLFCAGMDAATPDIVLASRPIKPMEAAACAASGVTRVLELQIGHDGIVIAGSRDMPDMALNQRQIFLALSAFIVMDGTIRPNPYRSWSDISPDLPDHPIRVIGPPPSSGTRDAFETMIMRPGCRLAAQGAACSRIAIREDGHWIDAGEDDSLIVEVLKIDRQCLGIFGYSFLHGNEDQITAVPLEGISPTVMTISDASYPAARPLYLYVKVAHLERLPELRAFTSAFLSEEAIGEAGFLTALGLVPLTPERRAEARRRLKERDSIAIGAIATP